MATSKVSIWWDIENCPVPRNVDPYRIAQNLSATLRHNNLDGPVTINAFGDTNIVKYDVLQALSSTGVNVNHIPSGNKDAADKAILVAMLFWALENPPPAHFLLISGDVDFANALHRLRMQRYNVLLVRPDQHVKAALLGAATSVWYWTSVVEGRLSALEHVEKLEEPQLKSTSMKKQPIDSSLDHQRCEKVKSTPIKKQPDDSSLHHQRSEEPVFKSTSLKTQPVDSSLDCRRTEPNPSKRSSGCSHSPLPDPHNLTVHDTQDQRFNGGSFPYSLPQCPKSAAEVSSNVVELNKLNFPDEKERKKESVIEVRKNPRRLMKKRHVQVCLNPKRRQLPKFGASLSEGTSVQPVEDNTINHALQGKPVQKYQVEFSVNKSEIQPESFLAYVPLSGDWESTAPPAPVNTQPYDFADMQPCVSDSLLRSPCTSFSSSDATVDFVLNEGPISNPIEKDQPSSQSKNPCRSSVNVVKEALETLKREGMLPTEANLQDCMCYWSKKYNVKLKRILGKSINLQEIILMSMGSESLRIFLPLNTTLWDCVNTEDMLYEYHCDIWMDFCHFLLSVEARQLFMKSHSKYEAAQILKHEGPVRIRCLSIGEIVRILHQSIQKKRLLQFHGSALSVDFQAVSDYMDSLPNTKLNPQPWVCNNEKEALADNSYRQRATAIPPDDLSKKQMILQKLRIWLVKTLPQKSEYDISLIPKDFEQATGIHLDHKDLGYSRLKELIQEFSDVGLIKKVRKGPDTLCPVVQEASFKPVSSKCTVANKKSSTIDAAHTVVGKQPVNTFTPLVQGPTIKKKQAAIKKLRRWLIQLPSLNSGYDISSLRKDFLRETGISLDHKALGYATIKDLIIEFCDQFRIENPSKGLYLLFPAKRNCVSQDSDSVKTGAMMPINGDDDIHGLEKEGIGNTYISKGVWKKLHKEFSKSFPPVHTPGGIQKGKVCEDRIRTKTERSEDTVNGASMHVHSTGALSKKG